VSPTLLFGHFINQLVQIGEPRIPKRAVRFEPAIELVETFFPQRVETLLATRRDLDQPCLAEHPQMFGDMRLTDGQRRDDVVHRTRTVPQQRNDAQAGRLAESCENLDHGSIYTPNGIYRSTPLFVQSRAPRGRVDYAPGMPSPHRTPPLLRRDACGLGVRVPHYGYLYEHRPPLDYLEIISENFLGESPSPRQNLDRLRALYPIVLHGVGLDLLGHAPLDEAYLDAVCRLADRVDAPFVTDHLCWTGAHGARHHDLLPTPYTDDLVGYAAERAHAVQRRLDRPFGLENLSSYVAFERSTMSEHAFYRAVVEEAGCSYLLDLNNIYVSSQNHGFSAHDYLGAIDFSRVLQVHLAGHVQEPDGTLVDTHDHPVCDEVWALYREAWALGGPFPTLLEWDEHIPPVPTLLAELDKAKIART
jgi:uncharacterized protein